MRILRPVQLLCLLALGGCGTDLQNGSPELGDDIAASSTVCSRASGMFKEGLVGELGNASDTKFVNRTNGSVNIPGAILAHRGFGADTFTLSAPPNVDFVGSINQNPELGLLITGAPAQKLFSAMTRAKVASTGTVTTRASMSGRITCDQDTTTPQVTYRCFLGGLLRIS